MTTGIENGDDDGQNCGSRTRPRTRETANRRNAKNSTGPHDTTSTRYNALKHGLLATGVTELDDVAGFPSFCAKIEAELKPLGEMETFLTGQIVLCMVRLKRIRLIEAEYVTAQLNPPVTAKQGGIDMGMDAILGETVVTDPGLPARLSADAVDALANSFARYETAIENRLFRALNQLERMQRLRQGEKIPAPVSAEIAVHG